MGEASVWLGVSPTGERSDVGASTTRSSSLIGLGADGATYRYADGPPCTTAYGAVEAEI